MEVTASHPGEPAQLWQALHDSLGLGGEGTAVEVRGATGTVERVGERQTLVRLTAPVPGMPHRLRVRRGRRRRRRWACARTCSPPTPRTGCAVRSRAGRPGCRRSPSRPDLRRAAPPGSGRDRCTCLAGPLSVDVSPWCRPMPPPLLPPRRTALQDRRRRGDPRRTARTSRACAAATSRATADVEPRACVGEQCAMLSGGGARGWCSGCQGTLRSWRWSLPRCQRTWWRRQSRTRLSMVVGPPSAAGRRWWASHMAGGRVQPRATQPRSRAARARRWAGVMLSRRGWKPVDLAEAAEQDAGDPGVAQQRSRCGRGSAVRSRRRWRRPARRGCRRGRAGAAVTVSAKVSGLVVGAARSAGGAGGLGVLGGGPVGGQDVAQLRAQAAGVGELAVAQDLLGRPRRARRRGVARRCGCRRSRLRRASGSRAVRSASAVLGGQQEPAAQAAVGVPAVGEVPLGVRPVLLGVEDRFAVGRDLVRHPATRAGRGPSSAATAISCGCDSSSASGSILPTSRVEDGGLRGVRTPSRTASATSGRSPQQPGGAQLRAGGGGGARAGRRRASRRPSAPARCRRSARVPPVSASSRPAAAVSQPCSRSTCGVTVTIRPAARRVQLSSGLASSTSTSRRQRQQQRSRPCRHRRLVAAMSRT